MKPVKSLYRWVFALIVLSFIVASVLIAAMPARVPMHYNAAGEVDRIGSKYENLILPCSIALVGGLCLAMARRAGKRGASYERPLLILAVCLCACFNVLFAVLMLQSLRLAGGAGFAVDIMNLSAIFLGALLIVTGNFMPKATRNAAFGLRTTWSGKNDVVWQRCQRFGGYSGVAAGVLLIVLSCFLRGAAISAVMLAVILLWSVVCVVASKKIYQKWEREQPTSQSPK